MADFTIRFDPEVPIVGCRIRGWVSGPEGVLTGVLAFNWYRKPGNGPRELLLESSKFYIPTLLDVGLTLELEAIWEGGSNTFVTPAVLVYPVVHPRRMLKCGSPISEAAQSPDTFSVLSYNVLAQCFVSLDGGGSTCPAWARSWHYREKRLLEEIIGYHADIVCLQEVELQYYSSCFKPELEEVGYAGTFKTKFNSDEGCAIFFLSHRFKEVERHEIEFRRSADELADKFETQKHKRELQEFRSKGQIALCLILEKIDSFNDKPRRICVANGHICPRRQSRQVQMFQVLSYIQEVGKIVGSQDSKTPLVICGDFNSDPDSDAYKFVTTGKVEIDSGVAPPFDGLKLFIATYTKEGADILKQLKLNHPMSLRSAYSDFFKSLAIGDPYLAGKTGIANEPLFTFRSRRNDGVLDYIFYSVTDLNLEGVLEMPDIRTDDVLSVDWPSDHLALVGLFGFKAGV